MRLHRFGFGFSLWRKKIANVCFMLRKIGDEECMKRVVPYLITVQKINCKCDFFLLSFLINKKEDILTDKMLIHLLIL